MGFSVLPVFLVAVVAAGNSGILALPEDYAAVDLRMSQIEESAEHKEAWAPLQASEPVQVTEVAASPCSCASKQCGCCQEVKIPALNIKSKACANVTFLSEQIGASLSLSLDGKVLFKKTISVKNPAPVCVKFPGKLGAQICGELYKLSVSPKEFEGCARLEGKLAGRSVAKVDLGCFKIPLKKTDQDNLAQPNEAWAPLQASEPVQVTEDAASPCSCAAKQCGCCQDVKIPALNIKSKACANVTFLSEQIGATLSLSLNGKVLFKKTVSVKNPAPVCVKFPGKFGAQICGELYKLSVSPKEFEGCARLEGKLAGRSVAKVDLGCFKIPLKKTDQVAAVAIESSVAVDDWSSIQDGGQCKCQHDKCSCCQHIKIKEIKIDSNVCIEAQFLSASVGVSVSLTIDGKVIFKKTMSLKNPPPICAPIHVTGGKICIALYDLSVNLKQVSGCARLVAKFFGKTVAKVKLGCFKIPLGVTVYGQTPEGVLYLASLPDYEAWPVSQVGPLAPDNFPLTFELKPKYDQLNVNED